MMPLWDQPEMVGIWPDGYGRVILDETDSTMREAARRAPDTSGPLWILAKNQTGAHGRRGRAWSNLAGNFSATLLLRPGGAPAQAALRSFLAANALYETLAMSIAPERLAKKWPNDVLLNGGKIAGILLESSGQGGRVDWLSIGIGVNLAHAPQPDQVEAEARRPVSLAGEGGKTISPEDFLFWFAGHYADQETQFAKFGFEPIRRLWLQHAAKLGEVITARTSRDTHQGTFEGIDDSGNLILRTGAGPLAIPAAEVFF